MTFLVDNQLPFALVVHIRSLGLTASHVAEAGLDRASDREIWQYAKANGSVIISKDEDFMHLAGADPEGPQFVWVRLGNCRTGALLAAFGEFFPDLVPALQAGEKFIELR